MSNENLSVRDAIYRNAKMGTSSIKSIIKKVSDQNLKSELEKQLEYYSNSLDQAKTELKKTGKEPNELNPLVKMWAKVDLEMQTMTNCDESKIAELMIQGTNMGIIEIEKALNANDDIPGEIKNHGKSVINHEQKYIETLKSYL